jgi:hypothetical protein
MHYARFSPRWGRHPHWLKPPHAQALGCPVVPERVSVVPADERAMMASVEEIGTRMFDALPSIQDITSRYSDRSPYHAAVGQLHALLGSEDVLYSSGRDNDALNLADYGFDFWVFTSALAAFTSCTGGSTPKTTAIPSSSVRSLRVDSAPILTYRLTGSNWTGLSVHLQFEAIEVSLPLEQPADQRASATLAAFLPKLVASPGVADRCGCVQLRSAVIKTKANRQSVGKRPIGRCRHTCAAQ